MKPCPYCGYSNLDDAATCHKCEASLVSRAGTLFSGRRRLVNPFQAKYIRDRGLAALVVGLLIKVYWGGYGPWPVIDNPTLASLRTWAQPLLIYGGLALYALGWALNWI